MGIALAVSSPAARTQTSGAMCAPAAPDDVAQLIVRFRAKADEWRLTFRNLVAEETKTIELFRASGSVEKRRQIVSDLVVYHSSRHGKEATTEYRDVRSVDGKAVRDRSVLTDEQIELPAPPVRKPPPASH